ncbi:CTP:molybdopterin cytidylyltransferase MocA [Granulicella aggregans]|uniref:CTP:molybdopterin cytidylyltransferase MocA n=1 Tax=Granulicella aggregans TaxID=474949 RepID=A0A7W8E2W4_9BACT|nr:nucleotidyltransferase family protein [Granulicella aggregans]MBB5056614.1 CTP:molybdopterin cytidylyltransferase MocA [Granulicella aggregans]
MKAAVILAAGASRRLGRPKQDVVLGGETLLERTVRIAIQAALDPVYVIVAPERQSSHIPGVTILTNPDAAEGMAASIRTGVLAAAHNQCEGIIILACDQPAVTPEHLHAIIANSDGGTRISASNYGSRRGVPAYFPSSAFPGLLELRGDIGARDLLASAHAILLANGELDIDTAEELARAQILFQTCEG